MEFPHKNCILSYNVCKLRNPPSLLVFFTSRDNLRHSMIYSTIIPRSSLYFSMTYVKTHTYMGCNSKIPSYLSTEPLKPQDCVDLNQGHRCWRPHELSYKIICFSCYVASCFVFPFVNIYILIRYKVVDYLKNINILRYLLTLFCKVIVRASMTSRPGFSIHSLIYLGCSLTGGYFYF